MTVVFANREKQQLVYYRNLGPCDRKVSPAPAFHNEDLHIGFCCPKRQVYRNLDKVHLPCCESRESRALRRPSSDISLWELACRAMIVPEQPVSA